VGPTPPPNGPYLPPSGLPGHPGPAGYPVPPPKPGLSLGAFLGILLAFAVLVLGAGLAVMTVLFLRERDQKEAAAAAAAGHATDDDGKEGSSKDTRSELPSVTRHVPNHSLRVLEGCSDANLATISSVLADAIDEGAPEYNEGKFVACYRTYVGAALDLEQRLPKTCAGPSKALANGRQTARGLDHASEQAWAMRDAFDGLLDVIARSRQSGGANL
jgi:hypothetical protein